MISLSQYNNLPLVEKSIVAVKRQIEEIRNNRDQSLPTHPVRYYKYYLRLGHLNRQLGNLSEALKYYDKANKSAMHSDAGSAMFCGLNWFCKMLKGEKYNYSDHNTSNWSPFYEYAPAPFVKIPDFLSDSDLRLVFSCVEGTLNDFIKFSDESAFYGQAGEKGHQGNSYHSSVMSENAKWIEEFFETKISKAISEKHDYFWKEFDFQSPPKLKCFLSHDKDYWETHYDPADLICNFHFHYTPKAFSGGDFLLFDTNLEDMTFCNNYTRLESVNNSLIMFSARHYHAVTPISCREDDPMKGRFYITCAFEN